MCTVFEGTRAEGKAEEIIETGHEFGFSEEDILARFQKKLGVSLQKVEEYMEMFGKVEARLHSSLTAFSCSGKDCDYHEEEF